VAALSPKAKASPLAAGSSRRTLARGWLERTLSEQLRMSLLGVPYNSFAPVLAAAGLRTPLQLGGNCIHQARMLADLVDRRLPGNEAHYLVDGRHHALVVHCQEEGAYYLDPYLGHLGAVRLPERKGSVAVRAYPLLAGRPSRLQLTRLGARIRVKKYIPHRASKRLHRTHRFEYDWLRSARRAAPAGDDLEIAIHPEVTTLSIRVMTRKGAMMSYAYSVIERVRYVVSPALVRYQEGHPRFGAIRARISRLLSVEVEDLRAYSERGITSYQALTRGREITYVYPNAITGGIIHQAPQTLLARPTAPGQSPCSSLYGAMPLL
jgi:hypothetical protein